MKEAKLKKEVKILTVEANGKTKEDAIGKIFTLFRKKVQEETMGVIVKLEPLETYLLDIKEEKKIERFLEIFMPREKTNYLIKMEIEYEIKYIKL